MSACAPARVLTIAGSDSSGGAGIQADIKTITMLGGYAMSAVTALTAQNSRGVRSIQVMTGDFVIAQARAAIEDIGVDAIKIGMLGSADIAHAVADLVERIDTPVVFDPVMVATSGAMLADADTIAAFNRLMARATLTTPNLDEFAALCGVASIRDEAVLADQAEALLARGDGGGALLVKGGHWPAGMAQGQVRTCDGVDASAENLVFDILFARSAQRGWQEWCFHHPRLDTRHTHGTGCTMASAIATALGQGADLPDAVRRAADFVHSALRAAPGYGAGHGPLGHQAVR